MTRDQLVEHLHALFGVPKDISDDADLRQYIADSIDVGELAAALGQASGRPVSLASLQGAYTVGSLYRLVSTTTAP
jgi:acyl carrier protein